MAPMREIHVAVGVIRRGDRVLIARRPDHLHQGGLLEFPGGKVEPSETVQQALVREILEETGLSISSDELTPLIGIRHDYGDKRVFLDVWEACCEKGEPEGREGQTIEWLSPVSLRDEDFPAANRPIIRAVRLPRRYAITGSAVDTNDFKARLAHGVPGQAQSLCLLRAPDFSEGQYEEIVTYALSGASGHSKVDWMLHGAPDLLAKFPEAAGVHMPWREANRYQSRPVSKGYWLAISCHNAEELQHAKALDADFITLSPVKPTESHPGAPALGIDAFTSLVADSTLVVYGLGGLQVTDERTVVAAGAQGIAGIGYWWPNTVPLVGRARPPGLQSEHLNSGGTDE